MRSILEFASPVLIEYHSRLEHQLTHTNNA